MKGKRVKPYTEEEAWAKEYWVKDKYSGGYLAGIPAVLIGKRVKLVEVKEYGRQADSK